mmetsp:Transcript_19503/g.21824  ORF Transcript_19503/g.21824 Transcript_19503/m.21824 type:complete len:93 (+) Transcript_19503:387-665(+)
MVPTTTTIIIIDASHCISKSKSKSSHCQYIRHTVDILPCQSIRIISEEEDAYFEWKQDVTTEGCDGWMVRSVQYGTDGIHALYRVCVARSQI